MKRLIVNADDFGFSPQVTDGIIQAHREGIVTSTTVMANMPAVEYAAETAPSLPNLSIGIHFNITLHRPILPPREIPSLTDSDGRFISMAALSKRAATFRLRTRDVEAELTAQIERLLELGIQPTHWDSHHHACWLPQTLRAAMRVAERFGVPAQRIYRNHYFLDRLTPRTPAILARLVGQKIRFLPKRIYYLVGTARARKRFRTPKRLLTSGRMITHVSLDDCETLWANLLANCPNGTSEMLCHPGLPSDDPLDKPKMRQQRVAELAALTSSKLKQTIRHCGIELVSFRDL